MDIIEFPDPKIFIDCPEGDVERLAYEFHYAVAAATTKIAVKLAEASGINKVVASGGCFLNSLLDKLLAEMLQHFGLTYIKPGRLPPGDQALALGQIGLSLKYLKESGL